MAFCAKCGASLGVDVAFCSRCGTAAGPVPHREPPRIPPPVAPALTSNAAAALSYLLGFVTGIVFLVLEPYKNDRFVRFHAFQSIFFSVAYLILWTLLSRVLLFGLFTIGVVWSLLSLVWSLVSLGTFLLWLFLMYKAYNNERFMIPILGDYAARHAG